MYFENIPESTGTKMDDVHLIVLHLLHHVYDLSCLLFWVAVRLLFVVVFIGQWCFYFLEFVYCSVDAIISYLPTCQKGVTLCLLDAGDIFYMHSSTFYNQMRTYTSLWDFMAVCVWTVVILRSPDMRKMVMSCLAFLIAGTFAIFRKFLVARPEKPNHEPVNKFTLSKVLVFLVRIAFVPIKVFARLFRRRRPSKLDGISGDSRLSCVVCCDRQKCILLLPCKHVCLCSDCSKKLMDRQRLCPLCRKRVTDSKKIYI